ncbi:MAG: class I SAM-dependent methyltransferase [Tissierellia bacterium]|nr:class I SAM-dependent methyltransferase [Tissierellia bacterium]
MSIKVKLCKFVSKLVKTPEHPFNMQKDGTKTYEEWQFENGEKTIEFYLDFTDKDTMFKDKYVLDIGCGAGGKSIYYVKQGASHVVGVDIVEYYKEQAESLAQKYGVSDKFTFEVQDAANLNFPDNTFDTVIMNDAMEHVDKPMEVLNEIYRVLKKGGRLYVNFPPYYHPYGAHLSDAIGFPWIHMFFSEQTLAKTYKELVKDLPDGQKRINFRISEDENGKEYFSYINHMTLRRFKKIKNAVDFKIAYYKEVPLRNFLKPLAKMPLLKEMFVKMAVCVFEK